jgi:hypothetical protein
VILEETHPETLRLFDPEAIRDPLMDHPNYPEVDQQFRDLVSGFGDSMLQEIMPEEDAKLIKGRVCNFASYLPRLFFSVRDRSLHDKVTEYYQRAVLDSWFKGEEWQDYEFDYLSAWEWLQQIIARMPREINEVRDFFYQTTGE